MGDWVGIEIIYREEKHMPYWYRNDVRRLPMFGNHDI